MTARRIKAAATINSPFFNSASQGGL